MIKKIICAFLVAMLLLSFQLQMVSADNGAQADVANTSTEDYGMPDIIEIMKAIGINDAAGGNSQNLTRAEFLYNIVRLTGYVPTTVSESSFSDVPVSSFYAGAVEYALDTKIISRAENFNPNNPIRLAEACKIAVSALGFDYYAIANGGFPGGYIKAAITSDLLLDVESNEILTASDALNIIKNFMFAEVYAASGYQDADGGTTILAKSDTVLQYYHDVEILEDAIITATVFSGIYEASGACDDGWIEIDNQTYNYSGNAVNMVGKCADVYYKKGGTKNTVLYLVPNASLMITTQSRNILRAENQTVEYTDGTRDKKVRLVLSPSFIYNNCAAPELTLKQLIDTDAEITFIDNDLNGVYDVVHINESSVSVVGTVNVYDELIICDDTIIDLSDQSCTYYLEKDGKECELSDIASGDVLWIYRSHLPGNSIAIYASPKGKISGTVTGIDDSSGIIYIDDTAYNYNKAFEANGLSKCVLGTKVTVALNSLGQVAVCTNNEAGAEYGYYISVRKQPGLSEDIQVKMLDSNGKIEIFTMDETITFDGGKITRAQAYDKLASGGEQLIRYIASGEKILKMIDTANAKGIVDDNYSSNDRLSVFEFPVSALTNSNIAYIPGSMMFHPHFQASAATKVFRIINDDMVEESQRYTVTTPSFFSSIKFVPRTDFVAYDIIETGQAGAIVYYADAGGTDVNQESNSGIVYSANQAVSPDGEKSVSVVVYKSGMYQRFYIDDEAVLKTISADASFTNVPLKKGDYIKYNSGSRNNITGITKDFDYQSDTVLNKFEQHMLYGYYYGKVYDCKDGLISLMAENIDKAYDDIKVTDGAYRYRFKLPGSITVYDSKTETIYQGSPADIVTYLQSIDDCHKILLRMYEGTIRDAVLYK